VAGVNQGQTEKGGSNEWICRIGSRDRNSIRSIDYWKVTKYGNGGDETK
jgi:hypothetical protein